MPHSTVKEPMVFFVVNIRSRQLVQCTWQFINTYWITSGWIIITYKPSDNPTDTVVKERPRHVNKYNQPKSSQNTDNKMDQLAIL